MVKGETHLAGRCKRHYINKELVQCISEIIERHWKDSIADRVQLQVGLHR
jgi:hypothetical protein